MNIIPEIKQINAEHSQLKKVIKSSIGNPTDEKINSVLLSYETQGKLIGAFISDQLVGCLGYELDSDTLIIKHLSVVDDFKNRKIGAGLIRYVLTFEDCNIMSAFTDICAKGFYEKLQFQCRKINSNFDTDRFECIYSKKEVKITDNIEQKLKSLSSKINDRYGFVSHAGDNFGEPVINSGPCDPFANEFYKAWNSRFKNKVKIAFVMQNEPRECYHVAIILPNNSLYDGGIGIHSEKIYLDKGLDIAVMDQYDLQLLDQHSYGLDRKYPRYCPDFDLQELTRFINEFLDELYITLN